MGAFDDLKSIGKVLQEAGKIEQYNQILETQKELLEMQKRIGNLEKENKELKEKLEIKENIILENGVYWTRKDGGEKDGPFCTRCWDKNKELIRMKFLSLPAHKPFWECTECKNQFLTGEETSPIVTQHYSDI
jgi:hypothetical protein